jgi:sugar O-acyltransferase (sialic acid O-acetyltransferase NeuD family)
MNAASSMNASSSVLSGPRGQLLPPTAHSVRRPAECRRILIVGAGGFGREVLHWARAAWGRDAERIAGFLSADPHLLDAHAPAPAVLGDPHDFEPLPGDGLVLAIGIPHTRRMVAESLFARGATFLSVVHPTAVVAPTASIGAGSIICPHAVVSDAARLGTCVLVNYHASLAHDTSAGDFAVLSPYAALAGGATIGADVFLALHASIGPGVTVGARSKVSANSCALFDVPADALVHGVPGRVTPLPSESRDQSR